MFTASMPLVLDDAEALKPPLFSSTCNKFARSVNQACANAAFFKKLESCLQKGSASGDRFLDMMIFTSKSGIQRLIEFQR